jgi:hypothetical protein
MGGSVIKLFRILPGLLSLLLAACGGQSSSPSDVVTGFTVTPGATQVTLSWDSHPGQIYAAYYKAGSNVTVADYDNLFVPVTSPYVISNLNDNTQYAFILTATNSGSTAGPPTAVITTVPGTNGLSWTIGSALTPGGALRGIAYGGNNYVAVGTSGASAAIYSTNSNNSNSGALSTWSAATTLPPGLSTTLSAVINDGTRFVALGVSGDISTSTDTLAWDAAVPIASGQPMNALAYGNKTYVAVGFGGAIASNDTGIAGAWTLQYSGTTQNLYGVSFVNGRFIAVGARGTLLTSDDGTTWMPASSNTAEDLWQVAFGANTYVAVGNSGTILSSSDGAVWTPQSDTGTTQGLYAICFAANARFVAVGDSGTVVYSSAGASDGWTATAAGTNSLYGIAPGNVLVAVGENGTNVSGN